MTKRPRSLSPPPKSKSVNSGKSKHVKKVAKGTGHRSTKGRASDDDFEFSPSPPKPPTAVTATATISKGGAALPVKKAPNKAVPAAHVSLLATAASSKNVAGAAAAVVLSPGKQPGYQPPAGMYPKTVLQVFRQASEGIIARKDKDEQGKEQQEVLPGAKKTWTQFPAGQDVSPESTFVPVSPKEGLLFDEPGATRRDREEERREREEEDVANADDEGQGDAVLYDTNNASATAEATTAASAVNPDDVHIDLGRADASTMPFWWDMFLNSKCGGGFLARSLFSAAAQDTVLGVHRWTGPTSVTQKKSALADMRVKWIEWNEDLTVNEWVRSKLFHIIVTNPTTYAKIKVNEVL